MVIWLRDSSDLTEYLVPAGKNAWKEEHHVVTERSHEAIRSELEQASVRLRLDSKLFVLTAGDMVDNSSIATYEMYGRSSTSVTVT